MGIPLGRFMAANGEQTEMNLFEVGNLFDWICLANSLKNIDDAKRVVQTLLVPSIKNAPEAESNRYALRRPGV
jgi:hypothetical protein